MGCQGGASVIRLLLGDCMERMADMPEGSVDVVCVDPPYGLEFMGKQWDAPWKYTINPHGFSDGGDRLPAPSFTSSRNPTCQKCGKRKRTWETGPPACSCDVPEFDDQKHRARDMLRYQCWSVNWLEATRRVLVPGGTIKTFGGTRVFHRLGAAMDTVGFTDIHFDSWGYGSGFPKSLNVGKALHRSDFFAGLTGGSVETTIPATDDAKLWEGWGTALKPAWEPVLVGRKG